MLGMLERNITNMDKEDCLKTFKLMCDGMVLKQKDMLINSMSKNSNLYHMTGLKETREEYIKDILDGTLNYFSYEILSFDFDFALVRLEAQVYSYPKSFWNLRMNIKYVIEDNKLKISECRVKMG